MQNEVGAEILLALGDFYWENGDAEGAFDTYQRTVLELEEPLCARAQALALLLVATEPEQALELLERSAATDPGDPETLFYLAELQLLFADYRAARDTWQQYAGLAAGQMMSGPVRASACLTRSFRWSSRWRLPRSLTPRRWRPWATPGGATANRSWRLTLTSPS